ncbi:malectin domain-containing carbohydrate-binding protein [Pleomorphovibrio marinus]|uniref:malectin domain-containing carbohydrate-binding protein n=1 Tax=Pleomorphovibrio marinus TaxID=2164132 RepID=UPI000E0A7A34|nr:malectin domain-containing carbohydrate-binding protein [Pleomorphovibrio marinus]
MGSKVLNLGGVVLMFFLSHQLLAADYYFSSESGDDNRSFAQAQNPATPWRSIEKLNSIFSSLRAGDAVLFKRGETYYGTIQINRSGSNGNPIRIGAYGTGHKPKITSFVEVKGWRSIGNGRFESQNSINSPDVKVVLLNGERIEMGRFPNLDAPNKGYLTISQHSGNSSVSSSQFSSSHNFNGGEVVIRKNDWIIDIHPISSHSGNTFHYSASGGYSPRNGNGFFIQNHINTLDSFGEWFYNKSSKKLIVYFGSANPNNYKLEVSTRDHVITKTSASSHILIEGVSLEGANNDIANFSGGSDVKISRTHFRFAGRNGIFASNVPNFVVDSSTVEFSYNTGIGFRFNESGVKVTKNIIRNTYDIAGRGQNGDLQGMGIMAVGNDNLIEDNHIFNSGYNGVYFGGDRTLVQYNFIDTFCFVKDDGGGIYAYVGDNNQNRTGRKVLNNIIINGVGALDGAGQGPVNARGKAEGIFLDDNSNGIEVRGNTIGYTHNSGIKMANTRNVIVEQNTFFSANSQVLMDNNVRGTDVRNNTIRNNILFSENPDQNAYNLTSNKNDIQHFANFDNNFFLRPLGDPYSIYYRYNNGSENIPSYNNLKDWQNKFGKDRNSTSSDISLKNFKVGKTQSSRYTNSAFNSNIQGINCSRCSWDSNGIDGGSLRVNSSQPTTFGVSIGSVEKGKDYVFRFKGKSDKPGAVQVYMRHAGSPWQTLSPRLTFDLTTNTQSHEVVFSPYATSASTTFFVVTEQSGFTYWMDDFEIAEAEVEFFDTSNFFLFEYNASRNQKTIAVAGDYVDVRGQKVSGNVTLAPFTSVVLINKSPLASEPEVLPAPEVTLTTPSINPQMNAGDDVEIVAEVIDHGNHINSVRVYNEDKLIGEVNEAPYLVVWSSVPEGNHQLRAVVSTSQGVTVESEVISLLSKLVISEDEKIIDEIIEGADKNISFNAGSNQGVEFQEDFFIGEIHDFRTSRDCRVSQNNNASSQRLFQTERFGTQVSYAIPLPNGNYTVMTYHNELYFGKNGPSQKAGQRVFDISIEGNVVKSRFDLFTENQNRETVLRFENIEVKDGILNLDMRAFANNATISGLMIQPYEPAEQSEPDTDNTDDQVEGFEHLYSFNTGSNRTTNYQEQDFAGEIHDFRTSNQCRVSENRQASSEILFQTERFGTRISYAIPVPNGTYMVKTYHNEVYFGKNGPSSKAGQRVFDIRIENTDVRKNLDLFRESQNRETVLTFNKVEVNDGVLNVDLIASVNNATISGISVFKEISGGTSEHKVVFNTGSNQKVDYQNVTFEGEMNAYRTSTQCRVSAHPNASSEPLFQTERFGTRVNYAIPLPNGTYTVTTLHNELYFGKSGPAARSGQRVFDILLEGIAVKTNFDMFVENQNRETILRFEDIVVTDGVLNIDLRAKVNNASISGIMISSEGGNVIDKPIVKGLELHMNTGLAESTSFNNIDFQSDRQDWRTSTNCNFSVNRTASAIGLFQSERFGTRVTYQMPVPNGEYTVVTYHNEVYFGKHGPAARAGQRVFDIYLQGNLEKSNFDMFVENQNKETMLVFESVKVTNGVINIDLRAKANNASISGISVYTKGQMPKGANLRGYREMSVSTDQLLLESGNEINPAKGMKLYPNPANQYVNLELETNYEIEHISIYEMNGRLVDYHLGHELYFSDKFEIPTDNLKTGVYQIQVVGRNGKTERARLVVKH